MRSNVIYLILVVISFTSCFSGSSRNICNDSSAADYKESIVYFSQKLEKNPNDQSALHSIAMSHYKLSQFEKAIFHFDKLIELNDKFPSTYVNRGLCKFFLKDSLGVCDDFKKSVLLGKNPAVMDGEPISAYIDEHCND